MAKKPIQLEFLIKTERERMLARKAEVDSVSSALYFATVDAVKEVVKRLGTKRQAEAIAALASLQSTMLEIGLQEELDAAQALFGSEINRVRRAFEELDLDFDLKDTTIDRLEALAEFEFSAVSRTVDSWVQDSRSVMMRTVLLGEDFRTSGLESVLEVLSKTEIARVKTELNTALIGYNRTVNRIQAQNAGLKHYVYIGPEDRITRPFCQQVLTRDPPIYTESEILKLDNGQGLRVFEFGGGWNCRHHWRAISLEFARELGYKR